MKNEYFDLIYRFYFVSLFKIFYRSMLQACVCSINSSLDRENPDSDTYQQVSNQFICSSYLYNIYYTYCIFCKITLLWFMVWSIAFFTNIILWRIVICVIYIQPVMNKELLFFVTAGWAVSAPLQNGVVVGPHWNSLFGCKTWWGCV